MKKILVFLLLVVFFGKGVASTNPAATLSAEARISLLTASPGPALYASFGHSALRVTDPVSGIDEVYNFGTFDFDTPNFYLKFLQGRLEYKLTVTTFRQFFFDYQAEGSGVIEQVFDLSHEEKNRIYAFLQINRLPENAYYLYDFFFDNCATRIRDILQNQLQPEWPISLDPPGLTFRQLLWPYVEHTPWIKAGIDLVLGLPSDRVASAWEYMYLPDHMLAAFELTRLQDGRNLVKETNQVLEPTYIPTRYGFLSPLLAGWIVFVLGILLHLKPKAVRIFDKVFFSFLGVVGIVIAFMWFVSDHGSTNLNLNLLWTFPGHLYFIFKADLIKPIGLPRVYFILMLLVSIGLILGWLFLPQELNPAFLPLILYMGVRSFVYGIGSIPFKSKKNTRLT
ncbi:MAG TPA: DUF4105 domain-containing protein [Bacteroidales bacterium]|nr:DUF4105 domain-containing protein [Bacteroidales bacterium]